MGPSGPTGPRWRAPGHRLGYRLEHHGVAGPVQEHLELPDRLERGAYRCSTEPGWSIWSLPDRFEHAELPDRFKASGVRWAELEHLELLAPVREHLELAGPVRAYGVAGPVRACMELLAQVRAGVWSLPAQVRGVSMAVAGPAGRSLEFAWPSGSVWSRWPSQEPQEFYRRAKSRSSCRITRFLAGAP
jgi:hypothetical protein